VDWLNYHHLRYFWMVAKEGSLRKAAERLSVSQPSISAQLRLLEDALGEKLFRRSGRGLQLTDSGRLVYGYAEEIFTIGREMVGAVKQTGVHRPMRVTCGIVDSVPKLVAYRVLRPLMLSPPSPVQLVCREGKLEELLGQLANHRMEVVLADEPAPSGLNLKVFNHPLGVSGITFCACGAIATKLRRNFPQSLQDAPVLLPTENTGMRMTLERWFSNLGISPKIIAEFEDSALLEVVATESDAFFPVHTVAVAEAVQRYGFKKVGEAADCKTEFFAITAERRLKHPAIVALTEYAHKKLFT
jgi:LysR family transcriptional activator of nhaA